MHAVTGRHGGRSLGIHQGIRQHEMIEAGHIGSRITRTARHARSQHRDQQHVPVGGDIFTGQDLGRFQLEIMVKVRGFGRCGTGLLGISDSHDVPIS